MTQSKWDVFLLNMQRRKLLYKERIDDVKWVWKHRNKLMWMKDIESACEHNNVTLSAASKAIEYGCELKRKLPSCFKVERIDEYKRMVNACDDCEDWEDLLSGEESESAAREKLREIRESYYLIPSTFDLDDYCEAYHVL